MTDFRKKILVKRIRRRELRSQIISAASLMSGGCIGYMALLVLLS